MVVVTICMDSPVLCIRPRDELKRVLERALRRQFPTDTVDISDGYRDKIHVLVVSRQFDGMKCTHQEAWLWQMIDATDMNSAEKRLISHVVAVSPALLK